MLMMTMTTNHFELHDGKERKLALDPTQSFIVQAPAGSGKTELLTQRYLVLLGCVKQPEEILAITFTKKSAAEMRARIIKALKNALEPEPETPHGKQTWKLARRALERNTTLGWNLLDNPNRLQIQTIDSFNASLTRQLPLLSNFGAPLDIIDDATPLYREAVQEFLSHLEEDFAWANAIEKLLLHMDNDLANVEKLLINMLAKRDQWLPYIATNTKNPELRKTLEKHLGNVVTDTLTVLKNCFPTDYINELIDLAKFAAQNLLSIKSDSPVTLCTELTSLPDNTIQDKKLWVGIANLLLTKSKPFNWRKSFTTTDGFPAPSNAKNAEEKKHLANIKLRLKELMDGLSACDELHLALKELTMLPEHHYHDTQWETLDALHDILRVVVALLKVVFQQRGQIDYIENAQAAYAALGTDEAPTDITLALDYKIQHILIDEFQDTSNSQYRLLERLITGWEQGDGRSLFVVGDPMQSIYRFREAEVGLFIRARKQGISHLHLEPLTLSVNFRSIPSVVNWVNQSFTQVFPAFEDIGSGAVSYSPSTTSKTDERQEIPVKLHPFINADETAQANAIVRVIQETQQIHPEENIAILVRSRTHLKSIIPALKAANLPFRALDIEPLTTRPVIQDLLALTRALLHPADRIAWLAILRAPWCGLSLSDLLVIASDKNKQVIWEQLRSAEIREKLSHDGKMLLERSLSILETALAERRRYSLSLWIEYTWLQLGGPACVESSAALDDAKAYFNLLVKLDKAGDLPDLKQLDTALNKLYAAPNNLASDSLQIMTIHNAKGLEFDTVILPHLERKASNDDKQLLQWMERPRAGEHSDLILAPIHAVGEEKNLVYDYIKRQNDRKNDYENGRLLYVAATRAKKQLHLFFNLKSKEQDQTEIKEPTNNSLLHKLWPAIHADIKANVTHTTQISESATQSAQTPQLIKRLTVNWKNPLTESLFTDKSGYHQKKTGFHLPDNNPKQIGTTIHLILQQIANLGIDWWQKQNSSHKLTYIQNRLRQIGMHESHLGASTKIIDKALANTLSDSRGQWMLSQHTDSRSEAPFTLLIEGKPKNLVVDRTFIDSDGVRWIIDYKATEYPEADLENFLTAQQKKYENQLWEYHLAFKEMEQRPIRVGLYFPLIPAWREWSF